MSDSAATPSEHDLLDELADALSRGAVRIVGSTSGKEADSSYVNALLDLIARDHNTALHSASAKPCALDALLEAIFQIESSTYRKPDWKTLLATLHAAVGTFPDDEIERSKARNRAAADRSR